MAARAAIFGAVLLSADALRKTTRSQVQAGGASNQAGIVDGLYTWGSPGVSMPPLKNPANQDGCFPGKRMWTRSKRWGFAWSDPIATIAYLAEFWHPYVDAVRVDTRNEAWRIEACSTATVYRPTGTGAWSYHSARLYRNASEWMGNAFFGFNFTYVATKYSKKYSDAFTAGDAPKHGGWRLVGRGHEDGSSDFLGGPQASNLFQNPAELDCMITFQGTRTTGDWFANFDAEHVDFCGLTGTTVHQGFRDHLRRMVREPSWQAEVRPRLDKCSKVYVAGHSLGGAMSTLFSACANSGNVGDEDYDSISWAKGAESVLMPDFA